VRGHGGGDGLLTLFIRHTSASLTIQENADPDVIRDLEAYFSRLVPENDPIYMQGSRCQGNAGTENFAPAGGRRAGWRTDGDSWDAHAIILYCCRRLACSHARPPSARCKPARL
jgi:hypothetical protein